MHKSEHHTIFYPADGRELALQSAQREEPFEATKKLSNLPCAILAPHASYTFILETLHRSFSSVADLKPKLVVLLGPLHQEPLEVDKPHFIFTPTGEGIKVPHTTISYATDIQSTLLELFESEIKAENSYFVEESAVELTLPFVDSYTPGTPVLPLLTATTDPKECKIYGAILEKIVALVPETLFVVSANLNAVLPAALATEHASTLVRLLEGGEPLLDALRSKYISSCGIAAFEALRHQRWGAKGWSFTSFATGGEAFFQLPQEYVSKERIVWHASAIRKEV